MMASFTRGSGHRNSVQSMDSRIAVRPEIEEFKVFSLELSVVLDPSLDFSLDFSDLSLNF